MKLIPNILKAVSLWKSKDVARENISSVLIETDGSLVATNGFGLIQVKMKEDDNTKSKNPIPILLESKVISLLSRVMGRGHSMIASKFSEKSITFILSNNDELSADIKISVPFKSNSYIFPHYKKMLDLHPKEISYININPIYLKMLAESLIYMGVKNTRISIGKWKEGTEIKQMCITGDESFGSYVIFIAGMADKYIEPK